MTAGNIGSLRLTWERVRSVETSGVLAGNDGTKQQAAQAMEQMVELAMASVEQVCSENILCQKGGIAQSWFCLELSLNSLCLHTEYLYRKQHLFACLAAFACFGGSVSALCRLSIGVARLLGLVMVRTERRPCEGARWLWAWRPSGMSKLIGVV